MRLPLALLLNVLALLGVAILFSAVYVQDRGAAVLAALVLSVVNTAVKSVFVLLTLPVTFLTLGLFLLLLNALLFWGVAGVVPASLWLAFGRP